jgi:ADP-ribose pyrophosphatase
MDAVSLLKSRVFHVERLSYKAPNGNPLTKDVVRHPGSVAIIPILNGGRICLIRNHRVTVNATLIEIPAGTMEPPEPALDCAHRELIEETGFRATEMRKLSSLFPAPGILDEEMHLFVATGLQEGDHAREPGEQIENYVVSRSKARAMVFDGQICDAKTIVGLLMYEQLKDKE